MFRTIKEITHTTHEISEKSHSNPQELGNLAQYLYGHYNQLAEDSRGAQGSCASDESLHSGNVVCGIVQFCNYPVSN
jgi:Vinculin Binding Site